VIASLSWVFAGASLAQAQVSLSSIGTAASKTTGTSITITTTSTVSLGNSIIVAFSMDPATGTISVTDSAANTYVVEVDVTQSSGSNNGVRTLIISAHSVNALASGSTITISHPSVDAKAASAIRVSGLSLSPLDRTQTAIGTNTSPSSGLTATTRQAQEILIGAIGVEGPLDGSFTPGAEYRIIGQAGTTGGGTPSNITIYPEYRFVSAIGQYEADAKVTQATRWAAGIATYRAASPTAVVLAAMSAETNGEEVEIVWQTVTEFDMTGFNVLRRESENGPYYQLNSSLIPAQAPGSLTGGRYVYTDQRALPGVSYWYILEAISLDGSIQLFGPVAVNVEPPADSLKQEGADDPLKAPNGGEEPICESAKICLDFLGDLP
jgi:hypothetical protein